MNLRKPAVAGSFYSSSPSELRETVENYISLPRVEPTPEWVVGIVAPHARYDYSGATAGFAYAHVRGKQPKRVVLLGCSHSAGFRGTSVFDAGGFEIPLGTFPIDEPFARALAQETGSESPAPHMDEHSLEVQLPFLWVAVGETPIVPVLFSGPAREWHVEIGKRLADMVDGADLVVASTDLSHVRDLEQAHQADKRTLDTILAQNCSLVIDGLLRESCLMCGGPAVVATMAFALARGAKVWSLLDYHTSAERPGERGPVVGYAAISMEYGHDG